METRVSTQGNANLLNCDREIVFAGSSKLRAFRCLSRLPGVLIFLFILAAACTPSSGAPSAEPTAAPVNWVPSTSREVIFSSLARPGQPGGDELSVAYQATGNSGAALAFAYVEAEKHSDSSRWRAAARSYQAGGAWTAALDAWLEVLALVPDDAEAHLQAGVILAPHDARRAYRHFVEVQNAPDFEPAARSLQAAIEESQLGDPSRQLSAIGTALASMHYWSQAEEALSMAVTLDAGFAEAWAYLGMVRAQQDKDGTGACVRAIAIQPDGPLTNYLCGLMWRAQGEISRSVAALSLAQSLAPGNPAFAAELGAAFQLASDFPEAEKWFEMAAALAPADPGFGKLLALFYADTLYELDGKALPTVQSAVDGQPADAELAAALGWVLFNLGDAEAASDAVNTALMLDPRSARALYYRGVISQAQGQGELAVNALVELLNHPEPRGFDVLARRVLDRMGYR